MSALSISRTSTALGATAIVLLLVQPAVATVSSGGTITRTAGTRVAGSSGDGLPATSAELNQPRDLDVAADGSVYITDTRGNKIRKVGGDGIITTFAGTGAPSVAGEPSGDGGLATAATMTLPHDVAVDHLTGIVYVADSNNHRVRAVALDGTISTVAGTGALGYSGDGGPATRARLKYPKGLDVLGRTLYLADSVNHRIRTVDLDTGVITTLGGRGVAGFDGDGGPASAALFNRPQRVSVDATGVVFVADTLNHRIRRIGTDGLVSTQLGTGVAGSSGDGGPATEAMIKEPRGVLADSPTDLYVSDSASHRVRHVDLTTGVVRTVAGTGVRGSTGDGGPAADARMNNPRGLALDRTGNLLIADTFNNVVRSVAATP